MPRNPNVEKSPELLASQPKPTSLVASFTTISVSGFPVNEMTRTRFAIPFSVVDLAGSVPEEIQNYTTYIVAIPKNSKEPEAVRSFVDFLTSPKGRAVLKSQGLD
jgi:molybdate transport system substrate-binding protein